MNFCISFLSALIDLFLFLGTLHIFVCCCWVEGRYCAVAIQGERIPVRVQQLQTSCPPVSSRQSICTRLPC